MFTLYIHGKKQQSPENPADKLLIVGVGASAGGLEAIIHLLMPVEGEENFCFVILLHRNPGIQSNLVSILQKKCQWNVQLIEDGMKPEPTMVYVAPADKEVHFQNGNFILKTAPKENLTPSIDKFFTSLAEENKNLSAGVILSGTGKDGSEGIKKIRDHGGYIICQVPSSGSSIQMPQSAINTHECDNILKPYNIFQEIKYYAHNHALIRETRRDKSAEISVEDHIVELLAEKTGTNFSQYKRSSVSRRINKRIEKLGRKDAEDPAGASDKEIFQPDTRRL